MTHSLEQELAHMFEPMNPTNMSFTLNFYRFLEAQGDFDKGDGSAILIFNHKPKGQVTIHSFAGRVELAPSGGNTVLLMSEVWGPFAGPVNWLDNFTS